MQQTQKTRSQFLKEELLDHLLEQLNLQELQKQYLRSRWFDQIVEATQEANRTRKWYFRLRMTSLTGGILLPGLIGVHIIGLDNKEFEQAMSLSVLLFAKVVAISTAAEHFLRYGERWQDYQRSADDLDAEGWQFMQLSGTYQTYQTHEQAYTTFVNKVEQLIKGSGEAAFVEIAQDQDSITTSDSKSTSNGKSAAADAPPVTEALPVADAPVAGTAN